MKPIKTIKIECGLDFVIQIRQYDNGDNEGKVSKFYQMHIKHESDTGVSLKMEMPLDGFDPAEIGKKLIQLAD